MPEKGLREKTAEKAIGRRFKAQGLCELFLKQLGFWSSEAGRVKKWR